MVDWTGIAAGASIAIVPVICVFIALQRYFVDRNCRSGKELSLKTEFRKWKQSNSKKETQIIKETQIKPANKKSIGK